MRQAKDEWTFREICRKNGWRLTRQRLAVYSFISGNRTHPGVDEVLAGVRPSVPALTRESVFRILCEFAEAGLVARLDHLSQARFDSCTKTHGHFICSSCGRIVDIDLPDGFRPVPPPKGATVSACELRMTGLCGNCRRKGKTTRTFPISV